MLQLKRQGIWFVFLLISDALFGVQDDDIFFADSA